MIELTELNLKKAFNYLEKVSIELNTLNLALGLGKCE